MIHELSTRTIDDEIRGGISHISTRCGSQDPQRILAEVAQNAQFQADHLPAMLYSAGCETSMQSPIRKDEIVANVSRYMNDPLVAGYTDLQSDVIRRVSKTTHVHQKFMAHLLRSWIDEERYIAAMDNATPEQHVHLGKLVTATIASRENYIDYYQQTMQDKADDMAEVPAAIDVAFGLFKISIFGYAPPMQLTI